MRAGAAGAGECCRGGSCAAHLRPPLLRRPPSKEEIAARTPQVVKCTEATREVTLYQTQGGKQFGRTYHFDRVGGEGGAWRQRGAATVRKRSKTLWRQQRRPA